MADRKRPFNLSVNPDLTKAVRAFVIQNPRKGRRNVSELTEHLWVAYLRRKKASLPVLEKV